MITAVPLDELREAAVLAVIRAPSAEGAVAAADAIIRGGIRGIEVTYSTPGGVAWELNYRGELDFLRQTRAQAAEPELTVEDGWLYFLHGWSEVIAEVFGLELTPERFERLRTSAETLR